MSISTTAEIARQARNDGTLDGIAWAIAICQRGGNEGAARDLLHECGHTVADFEAAEVEDYDLSQVRLVADSQQPSD